MVILRSQNKITDFLMILAWDYPFNVGESFSYLFNLKPDVHKVQMLRDLVKLKKIKKI